MTTQDKPVKTRKPRTPKADIVHLHELSRAGIRELASELTDAEARLLVNNYYAYQNYRLRMNQQASALGKDGVQNKLISLSGSHFALAEAAMKKALEDFTDNHPMGAWMKQIYGIGPVISAGILANFDITRAPTAGHFHSYAGLDPHRPTNVPRDRLRAAPPPVMEGNELRFEQYLGTKKRYHNADVKRLAWLIGQSFMKFSKAQQCLYGHAYLKRKEEEIWKNNRGDNAQYAALQLRWKDYSNNPTRTFLEKGMLSPAHIDARARRWTAKLFLSHLHQVWYEVHFKRPAPFPYAISHLNHAHFILPEHMQFVKGDDNTLDNVEGNPEDDFQE